jgi:hypothetical protein
VKDEELVYIVECSLSRACMYVISFSCFINAIPISQSNMSLRMSLY